MEPLHAPWRIAYIRGPKPAPGTAHLFKEIAESNDDEANYVVARDRTCFALLNRYPYTGGHLLVVPYKLSPDLNGLTEEELRDLIRIDAALPERADGGDAAGRIQHRHQSWPGGRRGHHRARACPRRAALERGHQFHACHREHDGAAGGADGSGGADCGPPLAALA